MIERKKQEINQQNQESNTINKSKLLFEGEGIKEFRNYFKLSNEIKRCKLHNEIKTAYVNNKNQLVIITNTSNKETLSEGWPSDAFKYGIKNIKVNKRYHAVIYNVDLELDVNNEEFLHDLDRQYNIIRVTRLVKKQTNEQLTTVRITIEDEEKYNTIINTGIHIGYTHFRAKPWHFKSTVIQCYKCLKLGHHQYTCKSKDTRCLRCSEIHKHGFKECKNKLRCSNCNGDHAACAKSCPVIIEHEKTTEQKRAESEKSQITNRGQTTTTITNHSNPTVWKIRENETKEQLNKIEKEMKTQLVTFIVEIIMNLNEVAASINDNPQYILEIIKKHFGDQTSQLVGDNITNMIFDESYRVEDNISDISGDGNMNDTIKHINA